MTLLELIHDIKKRTGCSTMMATVKAVEKIKDAKSFKKDRIKSTPNKARL